MKRKRREIAARFSLSLSKNELAIIEKSMRVYFRIEGGDVWSQTTNGERTEHIRRCVLAVARGIIRAGSMPSPLAVDVRFETEQETAERLEKLFPDGGAKILEVFPWLTAVNWRRN